MAPFFCIKFFPNMILPDILRKLEARNPKSETNSKFECSNFLNEEIKLCKTNHGDKLILF
jgi:hypothetical protein